MGKDKYKHVFHLAMESEFENNLHRYAPFDDTYEGVPEIVLR